MTRVIVPAYLWIAAATRADNPLARLFFAPLFSRQRGTRDERPLPRSQPIHCGLRFSDSTGIPCPRDVYSGLGKISIAPRAFERNFNSNGRRTISAGIKIPAARTRHRHGTRTARETFHAPEQTYPSHRGVTELPANHACSEFLARFFHGLSLFTRDRKEGTKSAWLYLPLPASRNDYSTARLSRPPTSCSTNFILYFRSRQLLNERRVRNMQFLRDPLFLRDDGCSGLKHRLSELGEEPEERHSSFDKVPFFRVRCHAYFGTADVPVACFRSSVFPTWKHREE